TRTGRVRRRRRGRSSCLGSLIVPGPVRAALLIRAATVRERSSSFRAATVRERSCFPAAEALPLPDGRGSVSVRAWPARPRPFRILAGPSAYGQRLAPGGTG